MIATGWTMRRTGSLVERNALIYRRSLTPVLSSIVEPVLYLLSIGFGVGALVGKVYGIDVRYVDFVAPGILATTAMNAAFNQTSFAIFMRIKNDRIYDAIVPTPLSIADIALGEVASAVFSGVFASCGFVLVMLPMFLFATTFYPLSVYPSWARPLIEVLPLYQSIQLLRDPALGTFHWGMLVAVLYLLAFGSLALALATRRLHRKLLP